MGELMVLPHRLVGLALVGAGVLLCATVPGGTLARRRAWRALAVANALVALALAARVAARLHDLGVAHAAARGLYEARRGAQYAGILAAAALAVAALLAAARRAHRLGGAVVAATTGTVGLALLTVVEAVSLHGLDAAFYRRIGPLLGVSWAWTGCAGLVIAAALSARRGR